VTQSPLQRDPLTRFSDRVGYYVQSRPKYPPALLEFCRSKLSLRPQHRLADIGSGTGFLSELFVRNGYTVFAVEPNGPMRAAAEELLGDAPNFHSVDGKAEATGLDPASVDFVLAGTAFHWFDRAAARKEFSRILRPGGWVALVWNERRAESTGFTREYGEIVGEFQTDTPRVSHKELTAPGSRVMADFFHPGTYAVETFANHQSLDLDGLISRALSSSSLPLPGQQRYEPMLARLREAFARHSEGGKIVLRYDTKAIHGRLN
jgi:SAM-dependent methyltransferase